MRKTNRNKSDNSAFFKKFMKMNDIAIERKEKQPCCKCIFYDKNKRPADKKEENDTSKTLNKDFDFTRTFIDIEKENSPRDSENRKQHIIYFIDTEDEEEDCFNALINFTLKEAVNKLSYRKITDEKIEQK